MESRYSGLSTLITWIDSPVPGLSRVLRLALPDPIRSDLLSLDWIRSSQTKRDHATFPTRSVCTIHADRRCHACSYARKRVIYVVQRRNAADLCCLGGCCCRDGIRQQGTGRDLGWILIGLMRSGITYRARIAGFKWFSI